MLFNPLQVGSLTLPNRILLAPLTRARADAGHMPNALMAEYYSQRATGGLLISECTMVAPGTSAFVNEPGIYNDAQIAAWRQVTDAVHAKGGRIFMQIWHAGRAAYPGAADGAPIVSSSATAIEGEIHTPQGKVPHAVPHPLTAEEIPGIVAAFAQGARNAIAAGFDGVEVHGANGYLIDQFLRDTPNQRTDAYGGSLENRARLLFEVLTAVTQAIGSERVGLRLSPLNSFNSMKDSDPLALIGFLADKLNAFKLAYLHVMRADFFGVQKADVMPVAREKYKGVLVGNMGYVGVVVVGAQLALTGNATPGDIQSFIQYVRNFTQPVQQLGNVSNTMQSMAAATERVFEFLAAPEEEQKADAQIPEKRPGHVEFDHVKFGYTPDKTIIHDFSCEAQPGQTIAIVGPTGAGKTTLIKLLQRFYDVDGGSLRVEGVDVRDWDRAALRGEFAMVLQDTWLFNGTIRENIRYGRPDATDAEVEAAARAARCDHFIHTLAGGYDFMINEEGTNLSQGQRQLVTIARAILADRPALILDEATSNVDTRTEELIQRAMDALMQGRTSFVIAHRLSTIRNADVILVIRDGDIVEKGTHDELLAQGGFYADLYNSQFDEAA